jgi:hypothetical protein
MELPVVADVVEIAASRCNIALRFTTNARSRRFVHGRCGRIAGGASVESR